MNSFTYLFSAFLLIGVAVGQSPTPTPSPDFDCPTGVPDGTTYPNPTDCTKYYVCTNGLAWVEQCPAGLWYDPVADQCDWPEVVTCAASPAPTTPGSSTPGSGYSCPSGAPDDSYPDPYDCTKYFVCTGGVAFPEHCPDGLWYDTVSKQCNWPDLVNCAANPSPSPSSVPVSSTVQSSSTSVTLIPSELPSSSNPLSSTIAASNPPTTVSPVPSPTTGSSVFTCPPNAMDGDAFNNPDDCSKYYVCVGGQAIPEQCPPGLWFDFALQQCNWPEVVNCSVGSDRKINSITHLLRKFRN